MIQRKLYILFILLYAIFCITGCISADKTDIVEIIVFDAGKADAILITTKTHAVMIDAGGREFGDFLVAELSSRDITELDYLIITHFDKDHVGGAAAVINNVDVKTVVVPNYRRDTRDYRNFSQAKIDNNIVATVLENQNLLEFALDNASFIIYPSDLDFVEYIIRQEDDEDEYDEKEFEDNEQPNVNNYSLVTSLSHGDNDFLFTGDAKARRIREILSIETIIETNFDFLKVPHHGRLNRRSIEFITTINPRYAVITCSPEKPADKDVVEALKEIGTGTFFTSNGMVSITSDGKNITIRQ